MSTEAPDEPFTPIHIQCELDNLKKLPFEPILYLDRIAVCASENCNAKMIGIYCHALQQACSLHGLSNIKVMIYPGSICRMGKHDRVFSVSGRTIYCPGKTYENCHNTKAFMEVTMVANFLQCLLSVDRLEHGKPWAHHNDVIALANSIFGKERAEEIKIYYEII